MVISRQLWLKRRAIEVSKLFYLIDLDDIYQMRPNLSKSDLLFRFYAPITLQFLDCQVWRGTRIRCRKGSITENSTLESVLINSWVCFTVSKLLLVSKRLMWNQELDKTNSACNKTNDLSRTEPRWWPKTFYINL